MPVGRARQQNTSAVPSKIVADPAEPHSPRAKQVASIEALARQIVDVPRTPISSYAIMFVDHSSRERLAQAEKGHLMAELNDPQLALERVQQFRDLLDDARANEHSSEHEIARSAALQLLPLVRQVAEHLDANLLDKLSHLESYWTFDGMSQGLEAADLLIGIIAYAGDARQILGPSGPVLAASGLHEWVWGAAQSRWDDGYYGDAVHEAAEVVQQKTQVKIGRRDLSGTKLYQHAFSLNEPSASVPRLRLPNVRRDDADAWRSAHSGAMRLGEACSQGIRNLLAHKKADLSEQQALEQLGALSVLARWIDSSELVGDDMA